MIIHVPTFAIMGDREIAQLSTRAAMAGMRAILSIDSGSLKIENKSDYSPVTAADRSSHSAILGILKESGVPVVSEEGASIPYEVRGNWSRCWMVDPLDGTKEYIRGSDEYTVNIAFIEDGKPRAGIIGIPRRGLLYLAAPGIGAIRFNMEDVNSAGMPEKFVALPAKQPFSGIRVIASRSHLSEKTKSYIDQLRSEVRDISFVQAGSALKFCLMAEGKADLYPRFSPCMEWDTAAGHAILLHCGKNILEWPRKIELSYNKESLVNPDFLAG